MATASPKFSERPSRPTGPRPAARFTLPGPALPLALACTTLLGVVVPLALPGQTPGEAPGLAPSQPRAVSVSPVRSATPAGASFNPTFAGLSSNVVFVSQAAHLDPAGVSTAVPLLRLHARGPGDPHARWVSAPVPAGLAPDEDAGHASATTLSNGLWVAFESRATNLVANDTNRATDVFLRDVASGTLHWISQRLGGGPANGSSTGPALDANGRRIVFESSARDITTNFFLGDPFPPAGVHLYARELPDGPTVLLTLDHQNQAPARGPSLTGPRSDSASLSASGQLVAFFSTATNLVAGQTNLQGDVFVRDLETHQTTCASLDAGLLLAGAPAAARAFAPALSADGSMLVFLAQQTGLASNPPPALMAFPLPNGPLQLAARDVTFQAPQVSADGQFAAAEDAAGLWLIHLGTGERESIGTPNAPPAPGEQPVFHLATAPALSADASRVAFLAATQPTGPWTVQVYDRSTGERRLVSRTRTGSPAPVPAVSEPALSADGRWVSFESASAEIAPDDHNGQLDVFLHDLDTGETHLLSSINPAAPATPATPPAPAGSLARRGGVTDLARFVAFASYNPALATPSLAPEPGPAPSSPAGAPQLFLRDRHAGTTERLAAPPANPGPTPTSIHQSSPALSRDARSVAWIEQTLLPASPSGDPGTLTEVVWRDRITGNSRRVVSTDAAPGGPAPSLSSDGQFLVFSGPAGGSGYSQALRLKVADPSATNEVLSVNPAGLPGNGPSTNVTISPNGRWVLFFSLATDLVTNAGPTFGARHLFARDLQTGQTRMVSTNALAVVGAHTPFSGDSRYVFFEAMSPTGGPTMIQRRDLFAAGALTPVCTNCDAAAPSHDGSKVAFRGNINSTPTQVFVRDLWGGRTLLASTNTLSGGGGNRSSRHPQISPDGRFTVFTSDASNLASDDTNNVQDLFVHDRRLGAVTLLSRGPDGAPGRGLSTLPVLAPDGRTVVFTSFAPNLADHDFNQTRDVLVVRLDGEDSDGDGLDDAWELAHFETLAEDGDEDHDGDGASNRAEFEADTHPADAGSLLAILPTSYARDTVRFIVWRSVPGRRYRIQYKRSIDDPIWTDRPPTAVATETTTTAFDNVVTPGEHRFYRILQEP